MLTQENTRSSGGLIPNRPFISIDELSIRHLRTRTQIEEISHLRESIDLSAHSAAGSDFHALEKKEMPEALLGRLNFGEKS